MNKDLPTSRVRLKALVNDEEKQEPPQEPWLADAVRALVSTALPTSSTATDVSHRYSKQS